MCCNIYKCVYTELEMSREEEKQMKSLILSFEKQIQSEKTLKNQVCLAYNYSIHVHVTTLF